MTPELKEILRKITGFDDNKLSEIQDNDEINFLDSLQIINLIVSLEENYNIVIEPDEIENINRISDINNIIYNKSNQ